VVDLGRSGSFRVRAGVKTSLVIDSESEIVLATVPSRLNGTVAARLRW